MIKFGALRKIFLVVVLAVAANAAIPGRAAYALEADEGSIAALAFASAVVGASAMSIANLLNNNAIREKEKKDAVFSKKVGELHEGIKQLREHSDKLQLYTQSIDSEVTQIQKFVEAAKPLHEIPTDTPISTWGTALN